MWSYLLSHQTDSNERFYRATRAFDYSKRDETKTAIKSKEKANERGLADLRRALKLQASALGIGL